MIDHLLESLRQEIQAIENQMLSIPVDWVGAAERWPLPSLHWRDCRYLTLRYSEGGRRWQKYIGADPERIREVLRGYDHQRRYLVLSARLARVRRDYECVSFEVYTLGLRLRNLITDLISGD